MSPLFPTSRDPWVSERPREAAALMVEAARASGMVRWRLTQARCITRGCREGGEGGERLQRGREGGREGGRGVH